MRAAVFEHNAFKLWSPMVLPTCTLKTVPVVGLACALRFSICRRSNLQSRRLKIFRFDVRCLVLAHNPDIRLCQVNNAAAESLDS